MNPLNEFIYNRNIKRQIDLIRHRNGLNKRSQEQLKNHDIDFFDKLLLRLVRLSGSDINKFITSGPVNTERLKDLYDTFDDFEDSSFDIVFNYAGNELKKLTLSEYNFQSSLIEVAFEESGFKAPKIKTLSEQKASFYFNNQIMVGSFFKEELKIWAFKRKNKLINKLRTEINRKQNLEQISRSLRGTDKRFSGILKATHFGASMVVDTAHIAATSASARALKELNEENLKIDFLYSSILDKKSSGKCFTRHNKRVFKKLKGEMSPIHFRCRTRMIPFIGNDTPPSQESVDQWFISISDSEKLNFLGQKKFNVYKNNKKKLKLMRDFISKDSEVYTLEQLEKSGLVKREKSKEEV